jgi:fimbrial isopeptide formation D2 family protein/LPXTG-motif cell wall-anchored protein
MTQKYVNVWKILKEANIMQNSHTKIRRMSVLVIAVLFAIMIPIGIFATTTTTADATSSKATNDSTATVVVTSGNASDTINLYKIIDVTISSSGSLDYAFTSDFKTFLASTKDKTNDYSALTISDYEGYSTDNLNALLGDYAAYIKSLIVQNAADSSIAVPAVAKTGTTDADGKATIESVGLGQYLVLGAGNSTGAKIYGLNTAKVVPFVDGNDYKIYSSYDVALKSTSPTTSKTIVSGTTGLTDGKATASLVNPITFALTATIPTYPDGATNKTLYFKDTLDAGLDFDQTSVKVYSVNDTTETLLSQTTKINDVDTNLYTVTFDGRTMYVDLNVDALTAQKVGKVTVKYDAVLNENANVGTAKGNTNTGSLIYSNDPYNGSTYDPAGDEDRPGDDPNNHPGYGIKTETQTVYTFGVAIYKTDAANNNPLAGVEFAIYKKSDTAKAKCYGTITTDDNGYGVFEGLEAGEYVLVETKALPGYKAISDQDFTINSDTAWTNAVTTTVTVKYTSDKSKSLTGIQAADKDGKLLYLSDNTDNATVGTTKTDYPAYVLSYDEGVSSVSESATETTTPLLKISVQNTQGGTLPGTGGIGTKIFYVVGAVLVLAAVVLLVTRKRMNSAE